MDSSAADLIQAARRHDSDAWNALLRRYQLPLYTYVAELLGDQTTALDILQDTFAAAVRHIATLREDARFASWLYGIAHQKCIQHWRRTQRAAAVFEASNDTDTDGDWPDREAADPREALLHREQVEHFYAALERLPLPQRSAVLLYFVEEFSLEEIAAIAAVPVGTVKSRLFHGKRVLRAALEGSA